MRKKRSDLAREGKYNDQWNERVIVVFKVCIFALINLVYLRQFSTEK